MGLRDFNSQRLYVDAPLAAEASVSGGDSAANHLRNVLRMSPGNELLLFNGRDGEWRASITALGRKKVEFSVVEQMRAQQQGPDFDYLFAPLKRARLDYMVQKATELGVRRLRPVLSERTVVERVNPSQLRANAIEAAELCGILHIPEILEPVKLPLVLSQWDHKRSIIFCDEAAEEGNPVAALQNLQPGISADGEPQLAVLVGPEGGFTPGERELLLAQPSVMAISIGPRIMRADTAAVAALSLVNAVLGDWR